ncbi:MAG: preprotein translocase subunit SecG [Moraxellaceae bacterium]|nr:MAG: preprotein translocase subunit SecG [Moraxellaceae bacterium]
MIETVLLITLVVVALGMVGLILIQQGKGADAGASFGSGGSQTFFGSSGSGNFLTHSTAFLATTFFVLCLSLAYIAREKAENEGRFEFDAGVVETTESQSAAPAGDVPFVEVSESSVSDVPAVDISVSDIPVVSEAASAAESASDVAAPIDGNVPAAQ